MIAVVVLMRQNDGFSSFIFWSIKRLDGRKTPLVKNGWYDPKLWLGCLVKALGGDPQKVYCRGTICIRKVCQFLSFLFIAIF